MAEALIKVEIAYANSAAQMLVSLSVSVGSTVLQAITASGILQQFPEIDLMVNQVGIFSQPCTLHQVLQAADRVEIYRPLLHDPKQARRNRALKK
ncbi:MAG: RnfH family protein [Methylococcaceae bacterium]|nr:RnfH family protein [Methylococcaceae bacterium]